MTHDHARPDTADLLAALAVARAHAAMISM